LAEPLPMTLRVYRKLSFAMVPLSPAVINRRLKLGKEDPARVGERRGMSADVRPDGPLVWIHGASVGEVLAAAALIERLRGLNLRILLTSGTVTSAAIVAKRFPSDVIHQYVPYDSPRYVARFLDHWRPSLALFIESDLWPNLILSSAARRLPMVLINGRMSHRSFPRWRRVAGTISALLGKFDVCLAQSHLDAERFATLGCRNVVVTGNLKLDVPAPPADSNKLDWLVSADSTIVRAHQHLAGAPAASRARGRITRFPSRAIMPSAGRGAVGPPRSMPRPIRDLAGDFGAVSRAGRRQPPPGAVARCPRLYRQRNTLRVASAGSGSGAESLPATTGTPAPTSAASSRPRPSCSPGHAWAGAPRRRLRTASAWRASR